jgi:hypothetical protein
MLVRNDMENVDHSTMWHRILILSCDGTKLQFFFVTAINKHKKQSTFPG